MHGKLTGPITQTGDTVGGLVAWSVRELSGASPSPLLDAELLIAFVTGQPRSSVLAFPERARAHGARRRSREARSEARAR